MGVIQVIMRTFIPGFNNDNHRIAYYDPVTKAALTPRQDYPGLRSQVNLAVRTRNLVLCHSVTDLFGQFLTRLTQLLIKEWETE